MAWPWRRTRQVERTCLDCGETWMLDASAARLKMRGPTRYSATSQAMRSGIRGGLGDYAAQAYAELDQQSELIRETRTCPKCGSGHFKDRRT